MQNRSVSNVQENKTNLSFIKANSFYRIIIFKNHAIQVVYDTSKKLWFLILLCMVNPSFIEDNRLTFIASRSLSFIDKSLNNFLLELVA